MPDDLLSLAGTYVVLVPAISALTQIIHKALGQRADPKVLNLLVGVLLGVTAAIAGLLRVPGIEGWREIVASGVLVVLAVGLSGATHRFVSKPAWQFLVGKNGGRK